MQFLDETLRKAGIGVWSVMPERDKQDWVTNIPTDYGSLKPTKNNANLTRVNVDALWRVGTRHELVEHYNKVMKRTYLMVGLALVSLVATLYSFSAFTVNFNPLKGLAAIGCAALMVQTPFSVSARYW